MLACKGCKPHKVLGGVVCPFRMCNAWDGNPKAQQYHNSGGGCGGYGGGCGGYGGYGGGCGGGKVGVSNIYI